jgi:signal transduction histidine kinase
MWQIAKHEGHYEMETLSMLDSHFGNYYVEMDKDISYVYEERERMYDTYKISLVVLCIVFSLLACLISFCYTRPVIRRLEDEARKQEEFTASFSHELKTPLTSIIGYADSLRSMQLSQEETAMSANYIFQEGRRLERLSWKMMELFYLDKQEIHFQQIPVKLLAQRLEEETKQALSKKKIRFSMQIDNGMINGDFDLLLSLLVNLTDNARKACAENDEITWMGACTENGYELQIKDNGIGIPEEEVDKITEAFYMVDKSRARKEGGAGLGMALCRKIVSLHQAEWKIESRIGEGTQITVRFPDLQAGQH